MRWFALIIPIEGARDSAPRYRMHTALGDIFGSLFQVEYVVGTERCVVGLDAVPASVT